MKKSSKIKERFYIEWEGLKSDLPKVGKTFLITTFFFIWAMAFAAMLQVAP